MLRAVSGFKCTVVYPHITLQVGSSELHFQIRWTQRSPIIWLIVGADILFIIGDWNAKVGSQEIPGWTGKSGLGVQNEAGQRLIGFCQEIWSQQTHSSNNTREYSTHGHHQIVNTKIRLILFFAVKDGEALYSQDQELTVAQNVNSLWQNSDLNRRE